MLKVVTSLEMDMDTLKNCIRGAELLTAKLNYDRAIRQQHPVLVHEDYFLRCAISSYLESLENEMKTENFN